MKQVMKVVKAKKVMNVAKATKAAKGGFAKKVAIKAMRAMRAMKTMKAMKAIKIMKRKKRVSKIARGKLAKSRVLRGLKEKTSGGLRADALMRNKQGKVVSKRASANGKRAFKYVEQWVEAHQTARSELRVSGFVAINGKSIQGKALYVKTKAIYLRSKRDRAPAPAPAPAPVPVPAAVPDVEPGAAPE